MLRDNFCPEQIADPTSAQDGGGRPQGLVFPFYTQGSQLQSTLGAGSIKGDVKSKHFPRSDRRGFAWHRALCGICRLSVIAWVGTAKVPIVVLSETEPTQAAWVGCQPWFYLRL